MDEEVAVDNVNRNNEEKIKLKKKDKKSKKSAMAAEEADNVDTVKAAESACFSENEVIFGVTKHHKRVKEKERTKKSKGGEDAEADMKNGSREELSGVLGENVGGQKMDSAAERNCESSSGLTMDTAERKKSRIEKKDKKKKPEMQDTEEVKREDDVNCQEGESVSRKESSKKVVEEKKNREVKGNDITAGEKDGEVMEMLSENRIVNNVTDIRMESKKDKKKNKGSSFVGSKDTSNETKFDGVDMSSKQQEHVPQDVEHPTQRTQEDGNTNTNHDRKKKKKHKEREKSKDDILAVQQDNVDDEDRSLLNTKESQNNEAGLTSERKKKKSKCTENGSNKDHDNEVEYETKGQKRKSTLMVNGSDGTSLNKSNKKVRFSDQDEAFTLPTNLNTEMADRVADNLVRGKRFTREEDKIVKDAVLRYIEENELGDEGLEMVLNCSQHRNLKGCWKEIASAISYRPYLSVYRRARILLTRSESQKSTQEERQMVLEHQKKHGNKWKALADELGKDRLHVTDLWRRIKLPNLKKGNWSQEEYQRLFDLVNTDLQLKLSEEKKSRYGMLRDNICWTAISDTHSTRAMWACCTKWYKQLTSSMAAKGVWSDSDDYRLLCALYSLDATCLEDVDWDDLIDNRPGEVCRKRWNQMVLHIGHNGNKSFAEQVEVLAQRYCPHLLEARVIWDNKPRVP